MREIKFRGKASHSGEWLFGYLINICGNYHILGKDDMREDGHHVAQDSDRPTWVDIETVGQYTGLTDKNGKEIYEGDIILHKDMVKPYHVIYNVHQFTPNDGFRSLSYPKHWEVVGNIHDNPELLKGGER